MMQSQLLQKFYMPDGSIRQHIMLSMDDVDLVVNPHYNTYDSLVVRNFLKDLDIKEYEIVSGDATRTQWVDVVVYDLESVAKIKLFTE